MGEPRGAGFVNVLSLGEVKERLVHRVRFRLRLLDPRRHARTFSSRDDSDAIQRIYVINLDRRPDRWRRQHRELDRFKDRAGQRLSAITRRFSAVDARYMDPEPDPSILIPTFTLADQLTVHPNPLLTIDDTTRAHEIGMTQQEIAVALSHIGVWKLVANGSVPSALILEDDVFLPMGFGRSLEAAWSGLPLTRREFDLLYLSFKEVGEAIETVGQGPQERTRPGIWQASGYVLTRAGAQKLLKQLPAYGPIDLWLNLQFQKLNVFTASRSIIEQNIDEPSTNAYSVLPVLSQVGVITREKPLLPTVKTLKQPVIVIGNEDSGLTALAKALSMLGYTCCSDLSVLPSAEFKKLVEGRRGRLFNAYVNVGSIDEETASLVARVNRRALFISTSNDQHFPAISTERVLRLTPEVIDKWAALTDFLRLEYPSFSYPVDQDAGPRTSLSRPALEDARRTTDLQFDRSPWIIRSPRAVWDGVVLNSLPSSFDHGLAVNWSGGEVLDLGSWRLRDDTFPSNRARFTPDNFSENGGLHASLTLKQEETSVRSYTSGAIASRQPNLFGRFKAELKPASGSGLITGLFLHRNAPRQEIDIEFLGKDTTKMLVNVYYNPGPEGTKLEYGYRGTPTEIELGFDAAAGFHTYEIEWRSSSIHWRVDRQVVYERWLWDPTPIPDQALEFNVNLWHSRSTELAGRLDTSALPAVAEIRSLEIRTG